MNLVEKQHQYQIINLQNYLKKNYQKNYDFDNYAIPGRNVYIDELLNNFNSYEHPQFTGVKNDPQSIMTDD